MPNSFSAGLYKMSVRGSLVKPVRLSSAIRASIAACIEAEKDQTNLLDEGAFQLFMKTVNWLEHKLDPTIPLYEEFSRPMARELYYFASRHTGEHKDAMQWIVNIVNRRYSVLEIHSNDSY